MGKMKILTARRRRPAPLHIDGNRVQYTQAANIHRLTNFGITPQITHLYNKGNRQLLKMKRFSCLPSDTKLYLFKALIRPMLEYPAVVLCTASRSALYKLQQVQSKALRWVHGPWDGERRPTNVELHDLYGVEPLNVRLHGLARRVWDSLDRDDDPNLRRLEQTAELIGDNEHRYFRRSRPRALGPPPAPMLNKWDIVI